MKIFVVSSTSLGIGVECGVDSAILRPGEPLFVAGEVDRASLQILPAVRIGRLGAHIAESRAIQHVDAFTLFLVSATEAIEGLAITPYACDRAFIPGQWQSIDKLGDHSKLEATVAPLLTENPHVDTYTQNLDLKSLNIAKLISLISKATTFKNGDLLLFKDLALPLGHPQLDTRVEVKLNDDTLISIKIK